MKPSRWCPPAPLLASIAFLGLACFLNNSAAFACTTIVISGRVTADGRPILWKNRDTDVACNEVKYFDDGTYAAVAVVNAGDENAVWMGANEAGFCIENSLSKDLASTATQQGKGLGNGRFMKLALQTCATVDDFEKLLKETDRSGRSTTANFGVIDAHGGAALFEAAPQSHRKYDANDPSTAPNGYIVRSNFAITGQEALPNDPRVANPAIQEIIGRGIYSGERFVRACRLVESRNAKEIGIRFVIRQMTRDLADPSGEPYPGSPAAVAFPAGAMPPVIHTKSTISRTTTVSAAVFHGVTSGEDPSATTMWTLLGDPKFSIAVPCWVAAKRIADPLEDDQGAELCEAARTLRDWALTLDREGVDTTWLPGIWQDLWSIEDHLIRRVDSARTRWQHTGFDQNDAQNLHDQSAREAMTAMKIELAQTKLLALARSIDGEFDDQPTVESEIVRVAIYDHSDGSATGPKDLMRILSKESGFDCVRLHPDKIRGNTLNAFQLLIVPGGSGSLQSKKLGEAGRKAIRDFVSRGGGYLGICAGSYLASSQYPWSLHLIDAHIWDRVHWARGTGKIDLELTADGREAMQADTERVSCYYGQGPLFLPGSDPVLPAYETLASYQSDISPKNLPFDHMLDTHAIIRSEFGAGRVVCISPHPEKSGGPEWIVLSTAKWAAGEPCRDDSQPCR